MKKQIAYLFSLILATAALLSPAFAGDTPRFDELDADGDGRLTQEEASQSDKVASYFSSIDRDGDGYVSRAEYAMGNEKSTYN